MTLIYLIFQHKLYQCRRTTNKLLMMGRKLPETCRAVVATNKQLENYSASVGFIHTICHDARSYNPKVCLSVIYVAHVGFIFVSVPCICRLFNWSFFGSVLGFCF